MMIKLEWLDNILEYKIKMSNSDLYFHDDVKFYTLDDYAKQILRPMLIKQIAAGKMDDIIKYIDNIEMADEVRKAFEDRKKVLAEKDSNCISSPCEQYCSCCSYFKICKTYIIQTDDTVWICESCRNG